MKTTYAIITFCLQLLLFPELGERLFAQGIETKPPKVILHDSFASAPSASITPWIGTTAHYRSVSTAQGAMLYLAGNTERADTSWLAAPSHLSHGEWNYVIDLKLEPSQSNRLELVLMSDTSNLKAPFSGYVLKAGDNGSADVFRLMRVDQGKMTPILSGNVSIAEGGLFSIKVSRMPGGAWHLFAAKRGEALQFQGSVIDTSYYRTGYSGFRMIYTKSNANAFGMGPLQILRFHPEILQVTTPAQKIHHYTLDTYLDTQIAPAVSLNDTIRARSTRWLTPYRLEALFDQDYARGSFAICIQPVNTLDRLQTQLSLETLWRSNRGLYPGDLLINEYLYNPPEGVPAFVEVYNATPFPLNLKDVELLDASAGSRSISSQPLWLPPDSLLVITPDSVSLTAYYGIKRAHYMSRFPYLNRSSPDVIKLRDPSGRILDSLYYKPLATSYGRSVERILTTTRSTVNANWKLSEHEKGASPGEKNSVKRPSTPARVETFKLFRNRKLQLWFDREMDTLQTALLHIRPSPPVYGRSWEDEQTLMVQFKEPLTVTSEYRVDLSGFRDAFGLSTADTSLMIQPLPNEQTQLLMARYVNESEWELAFNFPVYAHQIKQLEVGQATVALDHCVQRTGLMLRCSLKVPLLLKPDQEYYLQIRSSLDADGYAIVEDPIVIARSYEKGDLLLNEILTQPLQQRYGAPADQSQFVEIINTRGHTVYIDTLRLVTGSGKAGTPTTITLNNVTKRIPAQGFMVLLPDTISLADTRLIRFFGQQPGSVYVMSYRSTLSMPSVEGFITLHLGNRDPEIIDSLFYHAKMHQPSLRDTRGVSLERLSLSMPTTMTSNWNSFGGIKGASPGEKNSNSLLPLDSSEEPPLSVAPKVFSPDSDGREDVVSITIRSKRTGSHAHLQIFDRYGRHIQTILNGETLGQISSLAWNGLSQGGHKVPSGIYVITLSLWDPASGRREKAKVAVGLIHQGLTKLTFN